MTPGMPDHFGGEDEERETQEKGSVLFHVMGVDEEEVTPNAVIRDDLGAESIDFLDIMFRLEKAFGIKIPKGEMMPENLANDPNVVQNGVVTPAGIPSRIAVSAAQAHLPTTRACAAAST